MLVRSVGCAAVILLLCCSVESAAQIGRNRDVEALRRTRWVSVWVGSIAEDAARDGLGWRSLVDAVGDQLRRNGVPHVSDTASIPNFSLWEGIMLNVNVRTLSVGESYVYCARTEAVFLTETVLENGFLPGEVMVWKRERIGMISAGDLGDIQDEIMEDVDEFSKHFLTANAGGIATDKDKRVGQFYDLGLHKEALPGKTLPWGTGRAWIR